MRVSDVTCVSVGWFAGVDCDVGDYTLGQCIQGGGAHHKIPVALLRNLLFTGTVYKKLTTFFPHQFPSNVHYFNHGNRTCWGLSNVRNLCVTSISILIQVNLTHGNSSSYAMNLSTTPVYKKLTTFFPHQFPPNVYFNPVIGLVGFV